ncbi:MAG TPA: cysteine peptidase family C39 domain-containing protein [Gemmataceae bacterium]|jgi:hypothetical protein
MLRPFVSDVSALVLPLGLGSLAFVVGRLLHRLPKSVRVGLLVIAGAVIVGGAASLAGLLPDRVDQAAAAVGGATVVLCWAALLLIGVAWSAPKRAFSRGFLSCIVAVAGFLILAEGGSRLWWRFAAPELWRNAPDSHGCLRQTSGLTCAPAAAAMFLHCHGIPASEGEMAYLAGTSLFGSDAWQTAAALDQKVRPSGRRAVILRSGYDECVERAEPFIGHVRGPSGGHAVLVKAVSPYGAEVVDPVEGFPKRLPRADFEAVWDGTVVAVVPAAD